ncbi:thiolase [Exidia glandulosa HHB12029]|uniref:Thiolase n=1 Tax=Exidia glandulosa HHB12029 TaxID=1314781 RepID=A0A165DV17_EXIGL|nr:thiolase [Exidia glandulosa HHB12029]
MASKLQQLLGTSGKAKVLAQNDDDVVIVSALRTAITKAKKGGFKDTMPEELLSNVLHAVYTRAKLDPKLIDDIIVGNVLPPGGGATAARMAALAAGIPNSVPIATVNRQCSSGLTSVSQIAAAITSGSIDIGIGAGVESMTHGYGAGAMAARFSDKIMENEEAADCLVPMGITSENVAEMYSLKRDDLDAFAARSFEKAAKAQKEGWFRDEIVPVKVTTEDGKEIIVDRDDGVRDGVTKESLSKLKPAFKAGGTTHAGNASQVSDGAAAVLLARRSVAKKLGLPIIGKFVAASVVGVPPKIMGVGPGYAIPKVLAKTGLAKTDVDFYEINEAFATQAWWSIREIGLDESKVNPHGGAIALGHPLGATGARQIATGLNRAKRTGEKIFVTSMCIGSGMGMAAVFVNEQ